MTDKFIPGLIVKSPNERAPSYVKATLSMKRAELLAWLQGQSGEWINADIKESQNGKWYAQINTYKAGSGKSDKPSREDYRPPAAPQGRGAAEDDFDSDSIPF